jgi:predicted restriction endonuclease
MPGYLCVDPTDNSLKKVESEGRDSSMSDHREVQDIAREAKRLKEQGEFDPDNLQDARRWLLASIARRQGQPEFRQTLLKLYRGRCAISGTRVEAVLEGAHIRRLQGAKNEPFCERTSPPF